MAINEPLISRLYDTVSNYSDGTGTIKDFEVTVPVEIVSVGVILITAFVGITTSMVITIDIYDVDRATILNAAYATITVPTTAIGKILLNRVSSTVVVKPGAFYRFRISTAGVGTSGTLKVYAVERYSPLIDQTNVTVVTA